MASYLTSRENGHSPIGDLIYYPNAAITDIVGNGFFIVDQRWTVLSWNPMAEKLLGIPSSGIVGKNLWTSFMRIIPKAFYTAYSGALLKDIPVHFSLYWPKLKTLFDVTTCLFDDSLSVSFKGSGNPVDTGLSLSGLKSLNDMYRQIALVTTDCLWEWDFQARQILWIDGGHKRAFGYEIENALIPQRFWEARIHPEDKARVLASLHTFFTNDTAVEWEEEYRFEKFNGEYAYVHDRGKLVYSGDRRTSRIIGTTQDITARKVTEYQLLRSEQNLARQLVKNQKEITAAVLIAQEKERNNIGKELHDNLNQILGAAKLYIELAKTDDENKEMLLQKSVGYIVTVIEAIRDISKNLVAPRLNMMSLAESILNLVEDISKVNSIRIQFREQDICLEELDERLQLDIFRIVQEQLNNILKHANATQAAIDITRRNNAVELVVSDNGVGCDISRNNKGTGIMNIRSRADLHQGSVSIHSRPGEGYVLTVGFQDPG